MNRKRHVHAFIVTVAVGGSLAAGCSASVSVGVGNGGTPSVPKHSVENEVASTLAKQENQPTPKVVCPGDLAGKVGAVMYCTLTAQGATTSYPVQVRVDSVNGTDIHFNIQVSTTPDHFTAPS
jgi:hypothetical protein